MAKYAIAVMSGHSEGNPGGQARLPHALSAAKDLASAGEHVAIWFHGVGVTWLAGFDARYDQFTRTYTPLSDAVRPSIASACDFCTSTRFGAAQAAQRLGVPIVGGDGQYHTVAALASDGYQSPPSDPSPGSPHAGSASDQGHMHQRAAPRRATSPSDTSPGRHPRLRDRAQSTELGDLQTADPNGTRI